MGENLYLIASKGHGATHATKEGGKGLALIREVEGGLAPIATKGLACNVDEATLADESLFARTLSENEVEEEPQHGEENEHHEPGKCLDRVAIVENHHHHGT